MPPSSSAIWLHSKSPYPCLPRGLPYLPLLTNDFCLCSANENTVAAGKKTILPADVFKALDDTEFSFLKGPLEAEFASMSINPPPPLIPHVVISPHSLCKTTTIHPISPTTRSFLLFLHKYMLTHHPEFNAIQTEKRTTYRQKVRASKHGPGGGGDDTDMADTTMASEASASSAGPRAKKARVAHEDNEDEDVDDDEEIDAIVNDDDDVVDDDDDDEDEEEEAQEDDEDAADEDEDEAGDGAEGSSDETQDALEERRSRDEPDEALEGDESD